VLADFDTYMPVGQKPGILQDWSNPEATKSEMDGKIWI